MQCEPVRAGASPVRAQCELDLTSPHCYVCRYKNLIAWMAGKEKLCREYVSSLWRNPFPSYEKMHGQWRLSAQKIILKRTCHNGKVALRWPSDEFFSYIASQPDILKDMTFPWGDGEYVLIVPGDGFPGGARQWTQVTIAFANHGYKARTIEYNWTVDLALCSEKCVDDIRQLLRENLAEIQAIIDTGHMKLGDQLVCARVILGGDSPSLCIVLGITSHWAVGSVYTFIYWDSAAEGWTGAVKWSLHVKNAFRSAYELCGNALSGIQDVRGCTHTPLLEIERRYRCVVMCFLPCRMNV